MTVYHTIPPIWDECSKILILGSFPSVKSREHAFFYAHPQNRFWRLLAKLLKSPVPQSTDEKKELLLSRNIALWDVIKSCEIHGSSDASVRNALPNDLLPLISGSRITRIFTNGDTAYRLYTRLTLPQTGIEAVRLPSTSPANMQYSFERLLSAWSVIIDT